MTVSKRVLHPKDLEVGALIRGLGEIRFSP